MGEMITKPDANPVLLAILNGFILGLPIGYFMIGQSKKAIVSLLIIWLGGVCLFGLGYLWIFVIAYDAYLLGQKLARGEAITPNENGLDFLNAIFKD